MRTKFKLRGFFDFARIFKMLCSSSAFELWSLFQRSQLCHNYWARSPLIRLEFMASELIWLWSCTPLLTCMCAFMVTETSTNQAVQIALFGAIVLWLKGYMRGCLGFWHGLRGTVPPTLLPFNSMASVKESLVARAEEATLQPEIYGVCCRCGAFQCAGRQILN